MAKLTKPPFDILMPRTLHKPHVVFGRDLILIPGGVFLRYKSTHEIHAKLDGEDGESPVAWGRS